MIWKSTLLSLFLGFTTPIFVTAAENGATSRLYFQAKHSAETVLPVARYLPSTSKIKGSVIFIYGGSAGAAPFGNELNLDDVGKLFASKGYILIIPDYRRYILARPFDVKRFAYGSEAEHKEDFDIDVGIQLADLGRFIEDYDRQFPGERLFIMGHSYGGYLANILATERPPAAPIAGYISSHSVWGPIINTVNKTEDQKFYKVISGTPNYLPPMLVFHSKTDTQVGDQTSYFENWLRQGRYRQVSSIVFEGSGHFLKAEAHPHFTEWKRELFKFLSQTPRP